ncbi:MAG: hypothetical protein M3327_09700 [Actinomycetota bacterium]|nr:hypothetical protein [Actinomycetota bacterium]
MFSRAMRWIVMLASILALAGCSETKDEPARGTTQTVRTTADETTEATAPSNSETASEIPSETTTSASPPLRGHIIFTRAGGQYGDETIFFANADGTNERRLTDYGINCCPRISRAGKRILFAAPAPGERVTTATMSANGTGYKEIRLPDATTNLGPGAWSPDGKQIAFQLWDTENDRRDGIYIGSINGRKLKRLTDADIADIPGDFSPDGKRLAFFRESAVQSVGSAWVVKIDGTGLKRLTPPAMKVGTTLRWAPDGSTILFASAQGERDGSLWTVRPDGSNLKRLFKDTEGRFAISPAWSPSGDKIMFGLDPSADEFAHPPNELYVINADGSGLAVVINTPDFKREPEWVR